MSVDFTCDKYDLVILDTIDMWMWLSTRYLLSPLCTEYMVGIIAPRELQGYP